MELFHTHTFENGMRLLHIMSPTQVTYCGMVIDAGTRDEHDDEHGLAHFVEHMLFKGTTKRRACHILNRMESVGGDLNAFTSKEETIVHTALLRQHLPRAVELITDIVFNSTFPECEMRKEAEVIVEEIESYNDTPADLIFDKFENIIFTGHPLGHDILGKPDTVRTFLPLHAKNFTQRLYRPENCVFFVFGNYNTKYVIRTIEKDLTAYPQPLNKGMGAVTPSGRSICSPPSQGGAGGESVGGRYLRKLNTHQAHVMLGCPGFPSNDPRRVALYLLNNIIGGPGMNSMLNIALREKRGLVYTVESTLTNYTDTATFAIYLGCDPQDVDRCIELTHRELQKLIDQPLTERKLKAILKQTEGQIGVSTDNFENYAIDTAKAYLHYNKVETTEYIYSKLQQLTPAILQETAAQLFQRDNLTTLIYT